MNAYLNFGDGYGDQHVTLEALPSKGHRMFVSFAREMRIEAESPGYYTEDSLHVWRQRDGRWFIVTGVTHEVTTGSHRIGIQLTPAQGKEAQS